MRPVLSTTLSTTGDEPLHHHIIPAGLTPFSSERKKGLWLYEMQGGCRVNGIAILCRKETGRQHVTHTTLIRFSVRLCNSTTFVMASLSLVVLDHHLFILLRLVTMATRRNLTRRKIRKPEIYCTAAPLSFPKIWVDVFYIWYKGETRDPGREY